MDEKFVENLGMSAHVDEGLWDRLKGRAASFAQGAKNISGGKMGAVGTTEAAKFNSLFRSFVAEELALIKSLDKAVVPWAQHFKPEETAQIQQIEAFESALKKIDFGKLPVTEALPSFSNIGARWAGGVQNMLDSYKKRIASTYDNFINDVKKMNIVPEQYIQRKIASSNSGAYEALKALEPVIGKPIISGIPAPAPAASAVSVPASPTPAAATPPPVPAPAPAAATAPTPPASAPPTPTAPTSAEPETAPAPSDGTPDNVHVIPANIPEDQEVNIASYKLTKQAMDKLVKSVPSLNLHEADSETSGDEAEDSELDMMGRIRKYYTRNATKAEQPFPKDPVVYVKHERNNVYTYWDMRWRFVKEIRGHAIDILSIDKTYDASNKPIKTEKSNWIPLFQYTVFDVADAKTMDPKKDFDVTKLIEKSNSVFAKPIRAGESLMKAPLVDAATNKKICEALWMISTAISREPSRGKRQQVGDEVPPDQLNVPAGVAASTPPPEGPKGKEPMVNPDPVQQGRTEKIPAPASAEPEKTAAPAEKDPEKVSGTVSAPVSGPASAPVSGPASAEKDPEKPKEPDSMKLKDLIPKGSAGPKNSPKPAAPKVEKPKSGKPTDSPKSSPKAPAKPDPSVAPVAAKPPEKKSVVAPVQPAPEKPAAPTPAPAEVPASKDAERLNLINQRYVIPNKLAPLKTLDQLKKWYDYIGNATPPSRESIQWAHKQAMGTTPPPLSGPEKLKARTTPKTKVAEFKEYFL